MDLKKILIFFCENFEGCFPKTGGFGRLFILSGLILAIQVSKVYGLNGGIENSIEFEGSCIANTKGQSYVNGVKYCQYNCSLRFGLETQREQWNGDSKTPILFENIFKDRGVISEGTLDFGSWVCKGLSLTLDHGFTPPLPKEEIKSFPVSSKDLRVNGQALVSRLIYLYLNGKELPNIEELEGISTKLSGQ